MVFRITPPPTVMRENIRAPDTMVFLFVCSCSYMFLFCGGFPRFFEYLEFLSPFFLLPGWGCTKP